MRIAIIGSRGYPSFYGGFETYVRHVAPWLASEGHDVTVYGRAEGSVRLRTTTEVTDDVVCRTTPGLDRRTLSALTFGGTSCLDAAARRFDVALVLNPANGYFLPFLWALGVPTAVNVDGIEWEREKWSRLGQAAQLGGAKSVARWADVVLVDSEEIGRRWSSQFGRTSEYVPYGARTMTSRPEERVRSIGLCPESYALVVARLVPENNIDLLIDAAERFAHRLPFVFVGSAGYESPLERRLAALAERQPEVTWLGHLADDDLLEDLWFHSSVYLHGHSVGGTNPALLQAMGCGATVLAFDTGFSREVLRDCGLYFRHRDELFAAIEQLTQDVALRTRLGSLGRERIATEFTWERSQLRTLEALQSAVRLTATGAGRRNPARRDRS